MKFQSYLKLSFILLVLLSSCKTVSTISEFDGNTISLFDGKTFSGWEGDTIKTWKIVDGVIVGGSLSETVPQNDFLCTTKSYSNFILKFKYKIEGNEGLINSGVQFRSQRIETPSNEMSGYQADIGLQYTGALYDESRRSIFLAGFDSKAPILKGNHGEWNEYEVRAENNRIQLFLNGKQTVDYSETESEIPQHGLIALQIHGGGKALVSFKEITITELEND